MMMMTVVTCSTTVIRFIKARYTGTVVGTYTLTTYTIMMMFVVVFEIVIVIVVDRHPTERCVVEDLDPYGPVDFVTTMTVCIVSVPTTTSSDICCGYVPKQQKQWQ